VLTRRHLLAASAAAIGAPLTGCLSGVPGESDGRTATPGSCSATPPPAPTDAAAEPRSYPERPSDLTTGSVETFLQQYETAYQYNDALAANPDKIGRTNELTVYVSTVSVEPEDGRFTAEVSGQLQSDIVDPEPGTRTPATPTETPLPVGRGPFESSYEVTDRRLRRNGVVVECW
jgi:hypothetical protein